MAARITFRFGIAQIFIFLTVSLSALVSWNYYHRTSAMVLDMSSDLIVAANSKLLEQTKGFLQTPASLTRILAKRIEREGWADQIAQQHQTLWRGMWEPLLITPQLQSYFIADERGSYVQVRREPQFATRLIDRSQFSPQYADRRIYRDAAYNRISEKQASTLFDPRKRLWYQDPPNEDSLYWSNIYIATSAQTPVIAASHPIISGSGAKLGMAAANLPLFELSDLLTRARLNERQQLLIVNESGLLVAHSDKSTLMRRNKQGQLTLRNWRQSSDGLVQSAVRYLEANPSGDQFLVEDKARQGAVFVRPFTSPNKRVMWRLISISDRDLAIDETYLNHLQDQIDRFFSEPGVQVSELAHSFMGRQELDVAEEHDALWSKMWSTLVGMTQLQSLFVADEKGSYVQVRRQPHLATRLIDRTAAGEPVDQRIYRSEDFSALAETRKPTKFDPRLRPWYVDAASKSEVRWTDVYVSTSAETPVIGAVHPVFDRLGQRKAVVAVNIPLYSLSDFVSEVSLSPNSLVFLMDDRGKLVAYPDKSELLVRADDGQLRLRDVDEARNPVVRGVYEAYRQGGSEEQLRVAIGEEDYFVQVRPFPGLSGKPGWRIFGVIPESDLMGEVNLLVIEAAVISTGLLLIAVILIFIVAGRISNPIQKITKSMADLENFDLGKINGVNSRFKEIDTMSQALIRARNGLESFQKYVPADLVRELVRTKQSAKLGGTTAELTILFSDIEGFTGISEKLSADDLMQHLSEYLEGLSKEILAQHGTIDKYIGDAIMAFWGAPAPQDDAPERACEAALRCAACVDRLNSVWRTHGRPEMNTRFGIHTGEVVVGNLGSSERMNYSVIGDNVNLASRLEGVNKFYGTRILISESTYLKVKDHFHFRLVDKVAVKGRDHGVRIFELLGRIGTPLAEPVARFCDAYESALETYWARDWPSAEQAFKKLLQWRPHDPSVKIFIARCQDCMNDNALQTQDWDGTHKLNEK